MELDEEGRNMLGLSVDQDKSSRSLYSGSNPRSYQFAGSLKDRFNVVGVSTNLSKASHPKKTDREGIEKLRRRKHYSTSVNDMRKQEYDADAARLRALEEQLAEMQRLKEMKEIRNQQRLQRKREYEASQTLGVYIGAWLKRRRTAAAEIIKDYLDMLQKQQAVRAAAWAAAILRRLAVASSFRWRRYKAKSACATNMAVNMWMNAKRDVVPRVQIKTWVPGLVRLHLAHGYHAAVNKIVQNKIVPIKLKKLIIQPANQRIIV